MEAGQKMPHETHCSVEGVKPVSGALIVLETATVDLSAGQP
jgi:hypothetical protein